MIEIYFITNMFQSFPPSGEREGGFYHGFTGHEYLPWFKLYNMNGRLYDPVVGRFLEPDPVIQNATSTQNLNRYCYALNNPLKYVDPSGNRLMPGPGEERWINEDAERIGGSFGLQGGYWQSRNNFNTGHWEFIYGYRLQTAYAGVEYSEKYNDTRLIFEGARAVWVKDNSEIMRINAANSGGNDWLDPTLNYSSKANGGLAAATGAREVLEWEYIRQARINRALSGNYSQTVKHSMKAIKVVGKFTGVASAGIAWADYVNNQTTGNLIQAILNTGLVFYRVNPITGIIIGVADVTGASDYVYDQIGGFIYDF